MRRRPNGRITILVNTAKVSRPGVSGDSGLPTSTVGDNRYDAYSYTDAFGAKTLTGLIAHLISSPIAADVERYLATARAVRRTEILGGLINEYQQHTA